MYWIIYEWTNDYRYIITNLSFKNIVLNFIYRRLSRSMRYLVVMGSLIDFLSFEMLRLVIFCNFVTMISDSHLRLRSWN